MIKHYYTAFHVALHQLWKRKNTDKFWEGFESFWSDSQFKSL